MSSVATSSRFDLVDQIASRRLLARSGVVFRKNEPATSIYKVETGCIRTFAKLKSGRRADLAFYFPGDYFGLEARDRHVFFAEAAVPSAVLVAKRRTLNSLANKSADVARFLLDITGRELQRAQEMRLLLYLSASDRVGQFLLNLTKLNGGGRTVHLSMSRKDIADHLGLTIESVSRALTHLTAKCAISFDSHRQIRVNIRKSLAG
jgi:CRP/FNR family nitrogen fixation transcriptional regulator